MILAVIKKIIIMHFHNSHSFSSVTGSDEEGKEDEGGMANQWNNKGKDCHAVKYYRMITTVLDCVLLWNSVRQLLWWW